MDKKMKELLDMRMRKKRKRNTGKDERNCIMKEVRTFVIKNLREKN